MKFPSWSKKIEEEKNRKMVLSFHKYSLGKGGNYFGCGKQMKKYLKPKSAKDANQNQKPKPLVVKLILIYCYNRELHAQ